MVTVVVGIGCIISIVLVLSTPDENGNVVIPVVDPRIVEVVSTTIIPLAPASPF